MLIGTAAVIPARAESAGATATSYARVTSSIVIKGYDVFAEFDDVEGGRAYDTPAVAFPTPSPTGVATCLIAIREVNKKRVRRFVQEGTCPGRAEGYQFNHATMQARIAGPIPTERWVRVWKVRGNRWKLVTDKKVRSTATADISWQPIGGAQIEPIFCGFGAGVGRIAEANVSGSVRFNGLKLTVGLTGLRGELGWGTCASVDPF